ncbi:MAG: hypothetical protein HY812_22105 [Planctomycetes bacterium]|nr:hypothetical protein [Planctomycetota bacterium]
MTQATAELTGVGGKGPEELLGFLRNWWLNHILKDDMSLSAGEAHLESRLSGGLFELATPVTSPA